MSIQLIRRTTWILIPAMLIAAYFLAKPHETKPEKKAAPDRLQWTAKAYRFVPVTPSPGTAVTTTPGPGDNLSVPANTLDASLQVSLRFRPMGGAKSTVVNPIGSGTLTIRGNKYSFTVDSASQLTKHALSDGSTYLEGPMDIRVNVSNDTELPLTIGVSTLLDTGEGEWSYPNQNPSAQGNILFGSPFASPEHAKEIADIQRDRTK
jgi:hypothetical protein